MSAASKAKGQNVNYKLILRNKIYKLNSTITCSNVNNVQIDGSGCSFIYSSLILGINLINCNNTGFSNLTIDYNPLPFTQGIVTSITGTKVTVQIDSGYSSDATWLNNGDLYSNIHNVAETSVMEGTEHTYMYGGVKNIGNNTLTMSKVYEAPGDRSVMVNDHISLYHRAAGAMVASGCSALSFTNVNIYSCDGFAMNESSGTGGSIYKNVKIIPGPTPVGATVQRLLSVNADGLHFGNIMKGPTIDGCTISANGDDGVNIQGFFFHILGVNGNTITVTPKWDTRLTVGETIECYTSDDYDSMGTAKITAFRAYNDASRTAEIKAAYQGMDTTLGDDTLLYDITIDKPIANLEKGDHLTSLDRIGSGAIIKNSTFEKNRGHGIVAKGHDILIDNNTFDRNTHPAIEVSASIYWCESGFAQNVTISNNKITQSATCSNVIVQTDNDDLGSINVSISPPSGVTGFFKNMQNKNILIENNTINTTQVFGIMTNNCDGVTIKNNTVTNPFNNGIDNAGKFFNIIPTGGIFVGMSKNVTVTGNTVVGGGKVSQAVQIDPTCTAGTVISTNNILK